MSRALGGCAGPTATPVLSYSWIYTLKNEAFSTFIRDRAEVVSRSRPNPASRVALAVNQHVGAKLSGAVEHGSVA
jgi:hypothetical protein